MEVNFTKPGVPPATPVIDVETKVTATPTPVAGVTVDSVTTIAPAAGATPAPVNHGTEAHPCSVPVPTSTPTTVVKAAPSGLVLGDKLPEFKDIILPRINLAQYIGTLKDSFAPGSLVFGQNCLLFEPPIAAKGTAPAKPGLPPVNMVVLGFRPTRYVEKVTGGVRGLIVNTEAEVVTNGGTLDYNEHKLKKASGIKLFQPMAEAVVAVEKPEHLKDDGTVFVYEVEGKKYALALWAMKGTAYTAAAKRVFFTARTIGCLRAGYPTYQFAVSAITASFNEQVYWVPVCLPIKQTTPEFLKFVASVLNAPTE